MNKITTIIFDYGGVLVNDRSNDTSMKELIAKLPPESQNKLKQTLLQSELGQIPYEELLKTDKEILFPDKTMEEIKNFFLNTEVYEPFRIAEKLFSRYQVIIFSNNHIGAPEQMAKNLNIDISKFPFINSALVGMRKPDLNFYRYLIEKFKISPYESIFIDNMAHNLIPAEQLGFQTFYYRNNDLNLIEYLNKLGIVYE
jgi:putative hydrolase of the HAD superfamily